VYSENFVVNVGYLFFYEIIVLFYKFCIAFISVGSKNLIPGKLFESN
jgi:hypothetical protein